jgi:macrodomain Ter protein organizer (MatP/YcbG family)
MPIKSKAQRRKFAQLLVEGKISPETFEEWNRGAGDAKLPERLHPKARAKRKRKTPSKRAKAAKR